MNLQFKQTKKEMIYVRVTSKEHKKIANLAKENKTTIADVCRVLLLNSLKKVVNKNK